MTRRKKKIVAIILLVAIFVALSLTPPLSRILKTNTTNIFSPVVRVISAVGRKIGQICSVTFRGNNVVSQKIKLQEELDTLKAEKAILDEKLKGIESLYEQYDELKQIGFKALPADIIAWEPDIWYSTMLINRGSNDGVVLGTLVTKGENLAGRVVEVKGSWSRVRLLSDRRSVIPAVIREKGVKGVVMTTADNRLVMDYIDDIKEVKVGDVVITSEANHKYEEEHIIFPQGLVIGKISKIEVSKPAWYTATIEPAVDFRKLEKVSVLVLE